MKRLLMIVPIATLAFTAFSPAQAQVTQWDQRNDGPVGNGKTTFVTVSESFTPALSALDTVELCVASGSEADLAVTIRDDNGFVVGTSSTETTVAAGNNNPLPVTFTFASPVPLTPGDTYVIEGVVVSGFAWAFVTADLENLPFGTNGLWYREGLGVDVTAINPDDIASYVGAPTCLSPWLL